MLFYERDIYFKVDEQDLKEELNAIFHISKEKKLKCLRSRKEEIRKQMMT